MIGEIAINLEGDPEKGDTKEEVTKKIQAIVNDLTENTGLPWKLDGKINEFTYHGGGFNIYADLVIKEEEEEKESPDASG